MKVKWTPAARRQLFNTAKYIKHKFGTNAKDEFMDEVQHTTILLGKYPYMGKEEPFMYDRPLEYRSIVVSRINKIVYRLEENVLYIVALWDTRREPNAQAQQTDKIES